MLSHCLFSLFKNSYAGNFCTGLKPTGALVTNQPKEQAILECLTRLGLNVAALPCDSLQQLHDSITIKLHATVSRVEQILQ